MLCPVPLYFDLEICTVPNEIVKVELANPASPVPGRCCMQTPQAPGFP